MESQKQADIQVDSSKFTDNIRRHLSGQDFDMEKKNDLSMPASMHANNIEAS